MTITLTITDHKQLELIENLKGDKTAEEFAYTCIQAGIAEISRAKSSGSNVLMFASARQEFRSLDVASITAALKENDAKNPVVIEVGRLVGAYAAELRNYAAKNGNRLPKKMRVNAKQPIEKIAFQITVRAINAAVDEKGGKGEKMAIPRATS